MMLTLFTLPFWQQTILGLVKLAGEIALIVIPLTIIMEILKEFNVLEKITDSLAWTMKPFALPKEAVFPVLAGLIFGLVYGAGFIIQAAKEGTLSKRDLYLISLFLVINHSVFEDTLLFVAVGANGWIVLIFRFIASILITSFSGHFLLPAQRKTAVS